MVEKVMGAKWMCAEAGRGGGLWQAQGTDRSTQPINPCLPAGIATAADTVALIEAGEVRTGGN